MNFEQNKIYEILSTKIDSKIVKDLLSTYNVVQSEYFEGDDESTLSKSGKFVENVFRSLNYILTNQVLVEIKDGELNKIFDKLEKSNSKNFSDTIRLVIPRVAMTTYTMRSKMGSEHVKPTVPDFIDAKFVVSSCDWILSELLRSIHGRDPTQIDTMIQNLKSNKTPKLDSFKIQLAQQIDEMPIPELILVILRTNSPQTRSQMLQTLQEIGKDIGSWFKGGNFSKRIVKKGYAIKVGKDDSNADLFSLTTKGMIFAEKLIEKIKSINYS